MKNKIEEGQIVLCTVDRIVGTIVFVRIDDYNTEGTITFSEISPGRIRNIRDFVFPGKKIVCKVLKVNPQEIHLSLRRVKLKEKNELNDAYKREKNFMAILKTVVKDKAEKIIESIKNKEESLIDFLESAKENSKLLEEYVEKHEAEKVASILKERKKKEIVLDKRFSISSKNSDGIVKVKEIIKQATKDCEGCEVSYIAAGKYLIKLKTKDLKQGDNKIDEIIKKIENSAKQKACQFKLLAK